MKFVSKTLEEGEIGLYNKIEEFIDYYED